MIWHIAKRELYDNLYSLRFALATLLMLGLMLTNAVVHLREYPVLIQKYRTSTSDTLNTLKSQANLSELAQKGPGKLYKKPSPLLFCAGSGDPFLSQLIDGRYHPWNPNAQKGFWALTYPSATPNLKDISPDVTKVDWGFIIGSVLSLIALLFTFDSISSEREQGTLRLMLANSIPRHTMLIGKFLGAFISINIPFILAVLANLLVISSSRFVNFDAEAWGRLGIIFVIAFLYTSLFLVLGLLVSARAQQSAVSLIILLLTWVCLVVFIPKIPASIVGRSSSPMSSNEYWKRVTLMQEQLWSEYGIWLWAPTLDNRTLARQSEFFNKATEQSEALNEKQLNQQISQVQRVRAITYISPTAIFQHLLESFAGTGFERHLQFIENAQRYTREYRQFVVDTDRADPQSLHTIGIREGMSQKPISPEAIPTFEDTLLLNRDFSTASTGILLLALYLVVLLSGSYLAFVRVQI